MSVQPKPAIAQAAPHAASPAATHSAPHAGAADLIAARIDRIPSCRSIWSMVLMLSLGGFFEFYELYTAAYIAPGMVAAGILDAGSGSVFGVRGFAAFIAANFAGLWTASALFGFISDRYGRRAIFTISLLWYSACSVAMAFQSDPATMLIWRFLVGLGIGMELVTIGAYLAELAPAHMRGRAFAVNQAIQLTAVPCVALAAWLLVPVQPLGLDGWRWVVLLGALGALPIWILRAGLPESPRWLAARGQLARAEAIVAEMERKAVRDTGRPLPAPLPVATRTAPAHSGGFRELWSRRYAPRTVMMVLFHIFQAIGLYGIVHWTPTFLVSQGIGMAKSLGFTLIIALAAPVGPALATLYADRWERKWQIVGAALVVGVAGLVFGHTLDPVLIVGSGIVISLSASTLAFNFHAYQAELYPTRIRATAIGFVYSFSRLSGACSGFLIAWAIGRHGVSGAFFLIAGAMAVLMLVIGAIGPRTRGLPLDLV